jgi:hypothetical protein
MMKGRVLDKSKNIWNFTQNITTITDPIMEAVVDGIFKALGYLLIAGIALFAWKRADDAAESGKVKMVLGKGLLWCAGIALFASITLGHQSCEYNLILFTEAPNIMQMMVMIQQLSSEWQLLPIL